MIAKAKYSVKKWEEKTYEQISTEMKITKASVNYEFNGDLEGNGAVEYQMYYKNFNEKDQHLSSAIYFGFLRFIGKVNDKEGSFVMKDEGIFESGAAISKLPIIEGSGLGELKNIKGNGSYIANKDGLNFELEYEL